MSKQVTVLFIDDEENILASLRRLFMDEPYGIKTTTDAQEVMETLEKEQIKVIVSDHRMEKVSGVELLKRVKERHPDVIRILLTGYADIQAAEDAINISEVYRFINKPWNGGDLKMAVRQAIAHFDLILENKRLFEEAKRQNIELDRLNRCLKDMYEAQKEFSSTVSHELRTPLASIKTAIDLVVKKMVGEINQEQAEILGRAKSNVDRLKRLIDDILDLTKMEGGKLQMNFVGDDIHRVIQEVAESQKDVAQSRGLYLKTELSGEIPKIPFDNDRIVQVLNNLVSNAIKFTKEGGVVIKTQNKSQENHILVSVCDTGKGIAESDITKLFQKFQQIEPSHQNEEGGTGLGLAICKEIVTRHGGKIWVESKPGEGTAVNFILPIQERRTPA